MDPSASVTHSFAHAPESRTVDSTAVDESEAREVLLSLAERKTRASVAPILVEHVLSVTEGADWPVRRAAMEAVLRRYAFASRDDLRIAARPAGARVLGTYQTRRRGSRSRPYTTLLDSIDPLRGSCDCPDFPRNSLGLCKHLLVVLDAVAGKPARLRRARRAGRSAVSNGVPRLIWDPIRPLTGAGDWLERLHLAGSRSRGLRRWFAGGKDGRHRLLSTYGDSPAKRLRLVEGLLSLVSSRRRELDAEPAVVALLGEERARLSAVTADLDRPALRDALRSLRRKLYPYQIEGVERALRAGRLLLADDMGLGKTAQSIAVCHTLRYLGRVRRGLVIAPASLKPQWLREWQLFTNEPVEIVDGRPDERRRFYERRRGFLITNYEQVIRDLEWIHSWEPDIVVLDEAQRIKNWATKTAATVKRLRPPYRLVLTGTPMENRLEELASLFDWIDDLALEPKWRLVPFHSTYVDGRREVAGARNLDTLRTRLGARLLRRRRAEVIRQLPSRTDTTVPVELTEAQCSEHDDLHQPIARLVAMAQRRPLTQAEFLRLMSLLTMQRMVANGIALFDFSNVWEGIAAVRPDEALLRSLSSPKLLELREILGQVVLEQGRKIVVFSQWRRMLQLAQWAVTDLLADAGLRSVFFTGQERTRRRTHNLVDFHDDPAVPVLFATDAGGVGLNLQRAASSCVNLELPWNPAVLEQRIGRIYRLGQKKPIDVYNLVTAGSIEERIAGLVSEKKALFSGLFDGTSDEIRFERSASFLSQLERIVEPFSVGDDAETLEEEDEEPELEARIEEESEEMADPGANAPAPTAPSSSPETVKELFAGVEVHRRDDGSIAIEARPESAQSLLSLFEGMTTLLRQATR